MTQEGTADPAALERALDRFVNATLLHDDLDAALAAFADAQAHGLEEAGLEAELWAAVELRVVQALPDDVDDAREAEALLRRLRRGAS